MPEDSSVSWEVQRAVHAELMELEKRIARLESWRENQTSRQSAAPAWFFGTIAAVVSILTLLLNTVLSRAP